MHPVEALGEGLSGPCRPDQRCVKWLPASFNREILLMFTCALTKPLLLTWIDFNLSTWISNYDHYTLLGEIIYPFPNFNGCTVGVCEWINNFTPLFCNGCNYLSMLGDQVCYTTHCIPSSHLIIPVSCVLLCNGYMAECVLDDMMTPWHGHTFPTIGPLWGESTGHQWIPLTNDDWWRTCCSLCCQAQ